MNIKLQSKQSLETVPRIQQILHFVKQTGTHITVLQKHRWKDLNYLPLAPYFCFLFVDWHFLADLQWFMS